MLFFSGDLSIRPADIQRLERTGIRGQRKLGDRAAQKEVHAVKRPCGAIYVFAVTYSPVAAEIERLLRERREPLGGPQRLRTPHLDQQAFCPPVERSVNLSAAGVDDGRDRAVFQTRLPGERFQRGDARRRALAGRREAIHCSQTDPQPRE